MSKPRHKLLARLLADRQGVEAIEFAMTLPVLLLALLGIIEFGRVLWMQNALHYAVEEAARCATIDTSTCSSPSATQTYASTAAGVTFATSVFTVTTATCGNEVSASYPFQFLTSLVGYNLTLTAEACYPT